MKPGDYSFQEHEARLRIVVAHLIGFDFDRMLHDLAMTEALGPIAEPTAWRREAARLEVLKELVNAARKTQLAAEKYASVLEERAKADHRGEARR